MGELQLSPRPVMAVNYQPEIRKYQNKLQLSRLPVVAATHPNQPRKYQLKLQLRNIYMVNNMPDPRKDRRGKSYLVE